MHSAPGQPMPGASCRWTRRAACCSCRPARRALISTAANVRGSNRYANSLVALNAATGNVVWHQQLVHHDLWDYDVAAQPVLAELVRDGKNVAAVVQATKMGMLFVFDRETGAPLFDIERATGAAARMCRASSLADPTASRAAAAAGLTCRVRPEDAWGFTFWDRGACRQQIDKLRSEGIYTPPSLQGTILYPSYAGGTNWGGVAFDSERQWAIVPLNNLPMVVTAHQVRRSARRSTLGRLSGLRIRAADGYPVRHAPRGIAVALGIALHSTAMGNAHRSRPAPRRDQVAGPTRVDA